MQPWAVRHAQPLRDQDDANDQVLSQQLGAASLQKFDGEVRSGASSSHESTCFVQIKVLAKADILLTGASFA